MPKLISEYNVDEIVQKYRTNLDKQLERNRKWRENNPKKWLESRKKTT